MARLVPSTPSLRWRATFAVHADEKATCSITDTPLRPLLPPGPGTTLPGPLHPNPEALNTPTPTAPFGNVVKRRHFPYLRISLPCEPNRSQNRTMLDVH